MRKLQSLLLAGLLGVSSAAMADGKIAVVDYRAAISQSNEYKTFIENIKKQTSSDQAKMKSLEAEAKTLMDKLQKDSAVMSQAESAKLQKDIESKKDEFQFIGQKVQKAGQEGEQETVKKLMPKFADSVKEIAEAEGYDLVLEKGAAAYNKPSIDITDKVVQRINSKK